LLDEEIELLLRVLDHIHVVLDFSKVSWEVRHNFSHFKGLMFGAPILLPFVVNVDFEFLNDFIEIYLHVGNRNLLGETSKNQSGLLDLFLSDKVSHIVFFIAVVQALNDLLERFLLLQTIMSVQIFGVTLLDLVFEQVELRLSQHDE
jgi:hypothetical protein